MSERTEQVIQGLDASRRAGWAKWFAANRAVIDQLDAVNGPVVQGLGRQFAESLLWTGSAPTLVPESLRVEEADFGVFSEWLDSDPAASEARAWAYGVAGLFDATVEHVLLTIARQAGLRDALRYFEDHSELWLRQRYPFHETLA